MFFDGLVFCGHNFFHVTSQKCALSHVISFAVNYRLFSHGVVSYMFNEESDNVVLKYRFTHYVKAGLSLHWAHIGFCCLIDACSILMNRALRKPHSLLVRL